MRSISWYLLGTALLIASVTTVSRHELVGLVLLVAGLLVVAVPIGAAAVAAWTAWLP